MAPEYTIEERNKKTLRPFLFVELQFQTGDHWLYIDFRDIVSCKLTLHAVNTNRDNPDLEASTIEATVLKSSQAGISIEDWWDEVKGKDIIIKYRSGYSVYDGSQLWDDWSEWRTFYATLDEENFKDENGLITIKGTDRVGTIVEQNPGEYILGSYKYTHNSVQYRNMGYLFNSYIYAILKPFLPNIQSPGGQKSWNAGTVYEKTPNLICPVDAQYALIEPKSRRMLLAQFCNLFPGTKTADAQGEYNLNSKKFVFRDAGIPEAGWCDTAIGGNSSTINIQTWKVSYGEVADFKEIQGPLLKEIKMPNPEITNQTGISDPEAAISGYKHIEDKSVENGKHYVVDLGAPYRGVSVRGSGGTATMLNPNTLTFQANTTGMASIDGIPIDKTYPSSTYSSAGTESISLPINSEGNKTIELEPFNGMRKFTYKQSESYSGTDINYGMGEILSHQYADTNRQEWISFKWRGNPKWQPRDILIFTDKDNIEWYCEIDSLTLDHEDGGLFSEVKALKRYQK